MSYHEKRALRSFISGILLGAYFFMYVLQKVPQGNPYSPEVFRFWGSSVFLMIPVSIVIGIVVQIVLNVVTTAATREKERPLADERDHSIQLRGLRNALYVFILGFMLAMGSLVMEMPPSTMFLILFGFGFAAGMVGDLSQLYFYRRGF